MHIQEHPLGRYFTEQRLVQAPGNTSPSPGRTDSQLHQAEGAPSVLPPQVVRHRLDQSIPPAGLRP